MIDWYDLNARHEAALLWFGALLIFAIATSIAVRSSLLSLLKILLQRTLLMSVMGLFLVAAFLTIAAVCLGRIAGLWETLPVITVSIWSLSSGVRLLMNFDNFLEKDGEFKRACAVLTPATIIAALTNIAILSLWWEIVLLPLLGVLSFIFASYDSTSRSHNVAKTTLGFYTVVIVSLAIKNIVEDPTTWKVLAQAALLPIWLTIGTLPYIRFLIFVEQWRFRFRCPSSTVSSTDYGSDWPLVVDSAKLCCRHSAVWVEVDGKKYGVNGTSKSLLPKWGYTCFDLMEIWKDDRNNTVVRGMKVSVHRLIQDGLALERR